MSTPEAEVRHLFLLRHAEALDDGPQLSDIDRPLSKRGRRQAAFVAESLHDTPIDYVLCSSSTRTRETVTPVLATRCSALPTVVFDKRLYEAEADAVLRLLHSVPDDARSVLVVGHNPSMAELVARLAPAGGPLPEGLKKGACVHLTTTSPWRTLGAGTVSVAGYHRGESHPKGDAH